MNRDGTSSSPAVKLGLLLLITTVVGIAAAAGCSMNTSAPIATSTSVR